MGLRRFFGFHEDIPLKKDMSVERQIKAMYGWAIKVEQNLNKNVTKERGDLIKKLLDYLDVQGSRLEWRKNGLRSLPKGVKKANLKKKIS